jgi:hypothetical protein
MTARPTPCFSQRQTPFEWGQFRDQPPWTPVGNRQIIGNVGFVPISRSLTNSIIEYPLYRSHAFASLPERERVPVVAALVPPDSGLPPWFRSIEAVAAGAENRPPIPDGSYKILLNPLSVSCRATRPA